MMIEFCTGSVNTTQTLIHKPITVINIVVRHRKLSFVESSMFEEQRPAGEHARSCHCRTVASHHGVREITVMPAWQKLQSRSCHPVIVAMDDSGVLNTTIWINQTGSNGANA